MGKEAKKKFNITILEIYYIIMIIFKLLDYEILFSNKIVGWICAVIIHLAIVWISFKKINHNNLTRILSLGLIQYIVNAIEDTNIFYNFMLLITNIIIYYSKRNKDIKKDRKIIVIILMIFVFINLVRFYFMILFNISDMVVGNAIHNKYYYKAISSDSKYEVCIEEIPTGAGSSFRHDINLKENTFNFGTIKIQRIKHCSTLASASGEIIVKWEDNQKFSLWEKSVGEGRISFEYICEYTIDSFINSDTFINARNEEFREKMRKLKTVEDLNYEDNEKKEDIPEKEDDVTLFWHDEVHIWIINSKKELLMQSIEQDNGTYLNKLYVSVGVHPIDGENEKKVIKRELEKIIKTEIDVNKLKYLFSMQQNDKNNDGNIFNYGIYLLEMDLDINSIKLQEAYEVKKIYYKELEKMKINKVINPEECKIMLVEMNDYLQKEA